MKSPGPTTDSLASATAPFGIGPPHGGLSPRVRPGAVHLQVGDLGRSLDYYQTVLGMEVIGSDTGEVALGGVGSRTPLVVLRERPGARPVPGGGRLGLFHFALLLPSRGDLGRFLRHLSDVGVRAGASDHLVSEALYLRDPDGLGIEVYRDRPAAQWEARGDEVRMETLPLDGAAVLDAAGDGVWQGMPEGTVMGHVHLHVGDLARAASYYHEAIGFDKTTWSYPGALFLSVGGYHHHLGLNTWARDAAPAGDDEARLVEWTLRLPDPDDLARAVARLEAAGYPVAEGRNSGERVTHDPWGTQLRLVVDAEG